MAAWRIMERWQIQLDFGVTEVYLLHIDDVFNNVWRVEWGPRGGYRKGESYAGEGHEQRARKDLEQRKARYGNGWEMVT